MSRGLAFAGRMVPVLMAALVLAPAAFAAPGNGRVWEQVTPADKPGAGQAVAGGFNVQPDGNGLAYASLGAIHPDDAASGFNLYIGKRGASGWESTPISPVNTGPADPLRAGADRHLGRSLEGHLALDDPDRRGRPAPGPRRTP